MLPNNNKNTIEEEILKNNAAAKYEFIEDENEHLLNNHFQEKDQKLLEELLNFRLDLLSILEDAQTHFYQNKISIYELLHKREIINKIDDSIVHLAKNPIIYGKTNFISIGALDYTKRLIAELVRVYQQQKEANNILISIAIFNGDQTVIKNCELQKIKEQAIKDLQKHVPKKGDVEIINLFKIFYLGNQHGFSQKAEVLAIEKMISALEGNEIFFTPADVHFLNEKSAAILTRLKNANLLPANFIKAEEKIELFFQENNSFLGIK